MNPNEQGSREQKAFHFWTSPNENPPTELLDPDLRVNYDEWGALGFFMDEADVRVFDDIAKNTLLERVIPPPQAYSRALQTDLDLHDLDYPTFPGTILTFYQQMFHSYEEMAHELHARDTPPLNAYLSKLLQSDWKKFEINEEDEPLYCTFISFFWKWLIYPNWSELSSLTPEAPNVGGKWALHNWNTAAKFGQWGESANVLEQISRFFGGDPILGSSNVNWGGKGHSLRGAASKKNVSGNYTLENLNHHGLISFKLYNFCLIFFYKIMTMGFFIMNAKETKDIAQRSFENPFNEEPKLTPAYLKSLQDVNKLYMKFFPHYLAFMQNLSFFVYKKILQNNFTRSNTVGLSFPQEMGTLTYLVYNNLEEMGPFYKENANWQASDSFSKVNLLEKFPEIIYGREDNEITLPSIEVFNKNLLRFLEGVFDLIYQRRKENIWSHGGLTLQIIFSYYLFDETPELGEASNYTASVIIPVNNFFNVKEDINFKDWFQIIFLIIISKIEDFLVEKLLKYEPDIDPEESGMFPYVTIQTGGQQAPLHFFSGKSHMSQYYTNIALRGLRVLHVKTDNVDVIAKELKTFHVDSEHLKSWCDIYFPSPKFHCLLGIFFFLLSKYDPSFMLLAAGITLETFGLFLSTSRPDLFNKIMKLCDKAKVRNFIRFCNKNVLPSHVKIEGYIFTGNATIEENPHDGKERVTLLLYRSNCGIISEKNLGLLKRVRTMLFSEGSLPLFTYKLQKKLQGATFVQEPFRIFLGGGRKPPTIWAFADILDHRSLQEMVKRNANARHRVTESSASFESRKKNTRIEDDFFDLPAMVNKESQVKPCDFIHFNLLHRLVDEYDRAKRKMSIAERKLHAHYERFYLLQHKLHKSGRGGNLGIFSRFWNPDKVNSKKRKNGDGKKKKKYKKKEKDLEEALVPQFEDNLVIAWDCETLLIPSKLSLNKKYRCHCICTYSKVAEFCKYFWGEQSVVNFVSWIFLLNEDAKYFGKNLYFYSFNGARFDNSFIFFPLLRQFYGEVSIVGNLQNIKSMIIANHIYFYDLRLILTRGSLKELAKNLLKHEQKQDFPIMDYVHDLAKFEGAKDQIIKYCFQDCKVLYSLVHALWNFFYDFLLPIKGKNGVYPKFCVGKGFSIFKPTLSLLAMDLWKTMYRADYNIILEGVITSKIYSIIKESYKGGMCLNTCLHYTGKLYHYDIVSSYPTVMFYNNIPTRVKTPLQIFTNPLSLNDIRPFDEYTLYKIRFKFRPKVCIPYFPLKTKSGLIYPLSNMEDDEATWIWGGEVNNARPDLAEVLIYGTLEFDSAPIFKDYISHLFEERKKATEAKDEIKKFWLKLLMNSLYGKFGQKQFDRVSYLTSSQLHEFLIGEDIRKGIDQDISVGDSLMKRLSVLDDNILGEPFFQINQTKEENFSYIGSLIFISSFIASRARIQLVQGMYYCGLANVFYFDTDSLFTKSPIRQQMVIGDNLGQWKCEEDDIVEAYFLAPKVYACRRANGKFILHCKGIPEKKLKWEDFEEMYKKKIFSYSNIGQLVHQNGEIYFHDNLIKQLKFLNNKRNFIGDVSIPWNSRQEMDKCFSEK